MGVGYPKEIKEKKLIGVPEPLTRKQNRIIAKQEEKSLCQILTKECKANGFLCKISNKKNPVLITNHHVLDESQIKPGETITIYFTDENEEINVKKIKIDNERKTYTVGKILYKAGEIEGEEDIDTTIIELRIDEDKLNEQEFFELDKNLNSENVMDIYKGKSVYTIYHKEGEREEELVVNSTGIINEVVKVNKSYTLVHNCNTNQGSSGSPIVLFNHKVIGVHRGGLEGQNFNTATLLQYPIMEYCKKYINEIVITYKISHGESFRILGEKFVKNNEGNCKLLINKECYDIFEIIEYDKYDINKADNFITIILTEIKTDKFTDLSYMFCGCDLLSSLDFQSFNTKNVTNMRDMFSGCSSLKALNLSSFNTQNVTDMNRMFYNCSSLTSLNLSSFNTEKVTEMFGMFACCEGLKSLDLKSFNTQKVTNMQSMFCRCSSLSSVNVSSFNTQNVTSMVGMFRLCSSLSSLDLSSFNLRKDVDVRYIFNGCIKLSQRVKDDFNCKKK